MSLFSSIGKFVSGVGKSVVGTLAGSSPFGSIASAGLDVLGGLSSDSANFGNQMALQQQGQQWQEHIIDKQNQWNSAPAQAERYRQAGINPNMALGGGSSGIVSSGGSSGVNSALPTSDSVAISNEQRRIQMESDVAASQAEDNRASAAKSRAETDTIDKSRMLKLLGLMKQNDLMDSQTARNKAEEVVFSNEDKLFKATFEAQKEIVFSKMRQEQWRDIEMFAMSQIAAFNAEHLDERFQQEMALSYAQTILAVKSGNAQDASAEAYRAAAFLNRVMGNNQNYSPEQRQQLLEATLQTIRSNAASAGIDVSWKEFEKCMTVVGEVMSNALGLAIIGKATKALGGMKKVKGFAP